MITETYRDHSGKHRWRIKAPNGRIVAVSGEAFVSASNARRSLETLMAMVVAAMADEVREELAQLAQVQTEPTGTTRH